MTVQDLIDKLQNYPADAYITMPVDNVLREAEVFIDFTFGTAKITPCVLKNSYKITEDQSICEDDEDE